jgi:hypothetical protein
VDEVINIDDLSIFEPVDEKCLKVVGTNCDQPNCGLVKHRQSNERLK